MRLNSEQKRVLSTVHSLSGWRVPVSPPETVRNLQCTPPVEENHAIPLATRQGRNRLFQLLGRKKLATMWCVPQLRVILTRTLPPLLQQPTRCFATLCFGAAKRTSSWMSTSTSTGQRTSPTPRFPRKVFPQAKTITCQEHAEGGIKKN